MGIRSSKSKVNCVIDTLSQTQRLEYLVDGFIRQTKMSIPKDIQSICKTFIEMEIRSDKEILLKNEWDNVANSLPDRTHRMCVYGAGAVGKTAMILRLMNHEWLKSNDFDPTIEDSRMHVINMYGSDQQVEILDTGGCEQFLALQDEYNRRYNLFMLVYSINSKQTFEYVKFIYRRILRAKDVTNIPMVLVGNKSDLNNQREVTYELGKKLADTWHAPFIETSAKNRDNICAAFNLLLEENKKALAKSLDLAKALVK